MDRLRKTKLVTTLLSLIFIAACGPTPVVTHEIEKCGEATEVDMAPGKTEEIKADGASTKITVNSDSTITIDGMTMGIEPNEYFIGDVTKKHLVITILGDRDNDGNLDIGAKSVCPAPLPTPEVTPFSGIKGSSRYATNHPGFFQGRASKPVVNHSVFRRG